VKLPRLFMPLWLAWMLYWLSVGAVMNFRNSEYGAACNKMSDAGNHGAAADCYGRVEAWLSGDRIFFWSR
jgi:hypothetical protein